MLQNQKKMAFFSFFFFFQGYKFYIKLGALHYISAVLTLHAKYIVYGALTKDVWKDKNTEFTSEIECFGPLKSSFRIWFQKTSQCGLQMGLNGFLMLEDRALID